MPKRKIHRAEICVEAEEDVTPEMIRMILVNQLYFALWETCGGVVDWQNTLRVRMLNNEQCREDQAALPSGAQLRP